MTTALTTFKPQQTNLVNLENPSTIDTIKNSICKGASNEQLQTFLTLAKCFNLNPFNKEIYFSSQIGVFVGRHGKLRIANRHPDFKGLISCEIREKDEFVFDAAQNKIVKHLTGKNMGRIIGAWATGKRKGFDDVTIICWLDEYKKENPAWKNYTQDLIKYKCEDRVLRTLFNSEYEGLNIADPEDELHEELRSTFSEMPKAIAQITDSAWGIEDDTTPAYISSIEEKTVIEEKSNEIDLSELRKEFQQACKKNGLLTVKQLQEFAKLNEIDSDDKESLESWLYNMPEKLEEKIKEFLTGVPF